MLAFDLELRIVIPNNSLNHVFFKNNFYSKIKEKIRRKFKEEKRI